jgi:hypothetical protein
MRVSVQRLAPGIRNGDRADPGAEMTWIGGNLAHCLGVRVEQNGADDTLVLERDPRRRTR